MSTRFFVLFVVVISLVIGGYLGYQQYMAGPDIVAKGFVDAWLKGSYEDMYKWLSEDAKSKISLEDFKERYEYVRREAKINDVEILGLEEAVKEGRRASATYTADFDSQYVGKWQVDYELPLICENLLNWRIDWSEELVLPGLNNGERLEVVDYSPRRGELFDRNGEPLAIEGTAVIIGIEKRRVTDADDMAQRLHEILGLAPDWVISKYEAPNVQPDWFISLKTLPEDEYARFRPSLAPIPGVVFKRISKRIYPQGEVASQVVGYIGEVSNTDITKWPERYYKVGELVGRSGLESTFEGPLRGEPGYKLRSIGVDGKESKVFAERPVVHGKDIYLTLDMKIQCAAERALGDNNGAIVAIDPVTGELLAITSRPGFDPNLFSFGLSSAEWASLRDDERQPLFNRALNGIYPPGSTFKLITAAAALDCGVVNKDTIFDDDGTFSVRGNIVRNFRSEVFGEHSFSDAVIKSINTTFAKVGLDLGAANFVDYATKFGFDEASKIELPVTISSVGDPRVSQVELVWASVGQGRVVSTPLQMASVIGTIANKGTRIEPSLIYKVVEKYPDGTPFKETRFEVKEGVSVIKSEAAEELIELLTRVVQEGTGRSVEIPGFPIAGKTGTAEIARGSDIAHAWFVGFVPVEDPRFAFATFVERGGVGGAVAGPIAKAFIIDVFDIDLSATIQETAPEKISVTSFWEKITGTDSM